MVVTGLERVTADPAGAAGRVWRGLGCDEWRALPEALDNPDGERLYRVEFREARRRQAEREAAYREAQRPVCTRCGVKFTDERRQQIRQRSWHGEWDRLCGPCVKEASDRAEADCDAARPRPAASFGRPRRGWGSRSCHGDGGRVMPG